MLENLIAEKPLSRILMLFAFVILFRIHERDTATEEKLDYCITDHTRARANSEIQLLSSLWLKSPNILKVSYSKNLVKKRR